MIFDRRLLYSVVDLRRRKLTEDYNNGKISGHRDQIDLPVFIGLSKAKNYVRKLSHKIYSSMIHELEAAMIVGLHEVVLLGESV